MHLAVIINLFGSYSSNEKLKFNLFPLFKKCLPLDVNKGKGYSGNYNV